MTNVLAVVSQFIPSSTRSCLQLSFYSDLVIVNNLCKRVHLKEKFNFIT